MALSWTSINSETQMKKGIIDELFSNLARVEANVGISDPLRGGSRTSGTSSKAVSKDLIDIYRRTGDAYYKKFGIDPSFKEYPVGQGKITSSSIIELRNILNSFGL